MSLKHLADNIAAHGRHGDDTLVHVNKKELLALEALANKHGKGLTTNPDTGMPEAFGLRQILPAAVGFALAGPGGMTAMQAGLAVGGASALASGSLKQGMADGLGAWGGAGLAGAGAAATPAVTTPPVTTPPVTPPVTTPPVTPTPVTSAGMGGAGGLSATTTGYGTLSPTATGASGLQTAGSNLLPSSTANFTASGGANVLPASTADFTARAGMANTAATGAGTATQTGVLPGLKDSFSTLAANAEANPKALMAALAPAAMDELTPKPVGAKTSTDTAGPNPVYEYVATPGYGSPSYKKINAAEGGIMHAYADGGSVYPYSEPVVRMYGGGNTGDQVNPGLEALVPPHLKAALRGSVLKAKGPEEEPVRMAAGGDAGNQRAVIGALENSGFGAAEQVARNATFLNTPTPQLQALARYRNSEDGQPVQEMAAGGISSLGSYSDGGRLLKGPGDGMSDNIPAQIGRKQPARLADGEFVVPADVVSHLGNGSTDAGAKQLYKMMDRIRAARTGNKRQGKQINPNKFTPA